MISWIGAIRIRIYVVHSSKGTKEDTVKTNSLTNLWLQPLATQFHTRVVTTVTNSLCSLSETICPYTNK